MAKKKITELNNYEKISTNDVMPIVDTTTGETKKVSVENLLSKDRITFNKQFTVDNKLISIGDDKSEFIIDLNDIINSGTEGYLVNLPADNEAIIVYKGNEDWLIPNTTKLSNGGILYNKIISSKGGKLYSLPADADMNDLSQFNYIEILPLMRDEYIDKEGKVYKYNTPNYDRYDNEANALNISYDKKLNDDGTTTTYTEKDDLLTVNLYFREVANILWGTALSYNSGVGTNGNKYFSIVSSYLEIAPNNSWQKLNIVLPASSTESTDHRIFFIDPEGNMIKLKSLSLSDFNKDEEFNVFAFSSGGKFYIRFDPSLNIDVNESKQLTVNGELAKKNLIGLMKLNTAEIAHRETINNKIETFSNGKLLFVPNENQSVYSSDTIGTFYTKNYDILPKASYNSFELDNEYKSQEGIINLFISAKQCTDLGNNTAYNGTRFIRSNQGALPDVNAFNGILRSIDINGNEKYSINIPNLYSYNNISDEFTETYIKRYFSEAITLNSDYYYSFDRIGTTNGGFLELRIPVSDLEHLPAYNPSSSKANIIQSGFEVKSEDSVRSISTWNYNYFAISLTYTSDMDYVRILISQIWGEGSSTIKRALNECEFKIRYLVQEPYYKYNIDKIFLSKGDKIILTKNSDIDYQELKVYTPSNTNAALNQIECIVKDMNDLNYKIENVKYSSEQESDTEKIGKGDGTTDDTAAIQRAINNSQNISPEYTKEVVLKSGIYRISSPLKMNIEDLTLRGEGEVILWATEGNYEPIIRVMAGGCKIENIKIYLAKTEDDPNYVIKDNRLLRGYLKSYKESMDDKSIKYGNGHYCGIYIDVGGQFGDGEGIYGFYNVTIKDVIIQGAYRYSTKFIEKSYGIYFSNEGFCYFNQIQNCHFNSVMCGLYIAPGCNPCDVNCTFDIGDNIYNISGAGGNADTFQRKYCDDVIGLRWGIICESGSNTIHVNGQCVGEDSMNPYIYDEDGYEMSLDESTATVTGKQAYIRNNDNTYSVIEGETTTGFPDELDLQWKRITECGVLVRGKNNYIDGMIYDCQRSELGCIYLTSQSKYNKFEIRSGETAGYGRTTNAYSRHMYIPIEKDSNGNYTKWTAIIFLNKGINYMDCGLFNMDTSVNTAKQDHVFGSSVINSLDEYGITLAYPRSIDKVDDVAAYVDKIGYAKCYYVEDDGTETEITEFWEGDPSKGITTTDISSLFRPNNYLEMGIGTGITFKQIPTNDNPIIIEINFGRNIKGIAIGDIRFNRFICENIGIKCYNTNTDTWEDSYYNITENNVQGEFIWNTYNGNGNHNAIGNFLRKVRIRLGKAYQPTFINDISIDNNGDHYNFSAGDTYNPNGYVGIGKIFIGDYNGGGTAYLTRGGGKLYGDIDMNKNYIKLGIVDSLPEPSEQYRGKQIILKSSGEGVADKIYTCLYNGNTYEWV